MKSKILLILFICLILIGCNNKDDNNKYVFETDENIKYVFYYKDDTVTDFEIYIDFFDNETAKNSLEQYKKNFENDINIEDVTIDGKYIVIDYKKDYVKQNFGTDSIELIKMMKVTEK